MKNLTKEQLRLVMDDVEYGRVEYQNLVEILDRQPKKILSPKELLELDSYKEQIEKRAEILKVLGEEYRHDPWNKDDTTNSSQNPHAEGCMAGRQDNKPKKLRYMKHYKGDNTEPFEVENLEQIDMTIEAPLKSSASYGDGGVTAIWTEEINVS